MRNFYSVKPTRKFIDTSESNKLREILEKLNLDNYYQWILTYKSGTNTINGKLDKLDVSWHGIRRLPNQFLKELKYLREFRLDNNPNCIFENGCFDGAPNLSSIRMKYCQLSSFPKQGLTEKSSITSIDISSNPIATIHNGDFENLGKLQNLNISGAEIKDIKPHSFRGLQQILDLNLENNQITKLPNTAFGGLSMLSSLNLQNNLIEEIDSEAFYGLNNLEEIKLGTNRISILPKGVFSGLRQLTHLSLMNNVITSIGSELANLPNLNLINLDTNVIEHIKKESFAKSNNLTMIELQSNLIKTIEDNSFDHLKYLETINIQNNPLDLNTILNLPEITLFDYGLFIESLKPQKLHNIIISHYDNKRLVDQAMNSNKLLPKTRAFLRLVGYLNETDVKQM